MRNLGVDSKCRGNVLRGWLESNTISLTYTFVENFDVADVEFVGPDCRP